MVCQLGTSTVEQYTLEHQASVAKEIAREANKCQILLAMNMVNLRRISVTFDGCGDDGQMEAWEIEAADGTVMHSPDQLPAVSVWRTAVAWGGEVESLVLPLSESLEAFCYDLLEHHRPGWEIDDGSFGEFVFDLAGGTIALEHNQRFTDSVLTTAEF